MKILELDLKAYGPFTNKALDLSCGRQGLHVVYGLNEAGKSAALRAIHALLYGIPGNTADNFRHDNASLRVGGRLQLSDGTERVFFRRKGYKSTLLDANDRPLDETVLLKFLGGVGKEVFAALFGIDHDELVKGGQQLVAGGGSLGESLFAAGIGLGTLHDVLKSLEAQEGELFKPTGRTPRINHLISMYRDAQKRITEFSLSGREWVEHDETLRRAMEEAKVVSDQLTGLHAEKHRLDRLRNAIPLVARRRELTERLAALGDVSVLPGTFAQDHRDAVKDLHEARLRKDQSTEELRKLTESMEVLSIPDELIEQAQLAAELFERYGAYVKAQQDLPDLETIWHRLVAEATGIQKELRPQLPFDQVEAMRVTPQQVARIQELTSSVQSLAMQIPKSRKVVGDLRDELEAAKREMAELPAMTDPNDLRSVVEAASEEGNLDRQLRDLNQSLQLQQGQANIDLKRLRLWSRTLEQLQALAVPAAETIQRFEQQFGDNDQSLRQLASQIIDAKNEIEALNRQIDALRSAGDIPTEGDLDQARKHREKGWQLIRHAWLDRREEPEDIKVYGGDIPLPAAYEASVQKADHVVDRMRHEAQLVAKHATLVADRGRVEGRMQDLAEERSKVQQAGAQLLSEWAALWQPLGISPLTPREMQAWLQQREGLLAQVSQIRQSEIRREDMEKQIDELANRLGTSLEASGNSGRKPEETLQALLNRARKVVDQFDELVGKQKELSRSVKTLEARLDREQRDYEQVQADLRLLQAQWKAAIADIGLTEHAQPSEAHAVLIRIQELFKKIDEAASYRRRIDGIRKDSERFQDAIRLFCESVAADLSGMPVDQVAKELRRRLSQAQKDVATLAQLRKQHEQWTQDQEKARSTIAQKEDFLAQLCKQAGCENVEDLEAVKQRSAEVADLRMQTEQVNEALAGHAAGTTIADLVEEVQGLDQDSIPAQIARIGDQIVNLEDKHQQLNQTIGAERSQIQKMDGSGKAAEAAEEAQSILAEARDCSERYVRLHLAAVILRKEIVRFQDANQGPVLELASNLFCQLTAGAFSSITASFDVADEPVLLGTRASGERVIVEGMSEGTRDQLYLALRLGSLQRYLEAAEPMPFIIDDILVNFDDHRAASTLRVLAEISSRTQVIFFTHHAHLIELAKETVPAEVLFVHPLGTSNAA